MNNNVNILTKYINGLDVINKDLGITCWCKTDYNDEIKEFHMFDNYGHCFESFVLNDYDDELRNKLIVDLAREVSRLEECHDFATLDQFFDDYFSAPSVSEEEYNNRDTNNIYIEYYKFSCGIWRINY